MKRKIIIWATLHAIFIAVAVICICLDVRLQHEEIAEQIAKFGFYKQDLKVSLERVRQSMLLTAGWLSSLIGWVVTGIGLITVLIDKWENGKRR